MPEITANRKLKKKEFLQPDGRVLHELHIGDIHYEYGGQLVDVDYNIVEYADHWLIEKASYKLYVSKQFLGSGNPVDSNFLLVWRNRREGASHGLAWQPDSMYWVNPVDPMQSTLFRNAQNVTGMHTQGLEGEKGLITWVDAFGSGINFEIAIKRSGIQTNIVITNQATLSLGSSSGDLALNTHIEFEGGINLKCRDAAADWNQNDFYEGADSYDLTEQLHPELKTVIRKSIVWTAKDSGLISTVVPARLYFAKKLGKLWKCKIIPRAILESGLYPIRADSSPIYSDEDSDGCAYVATDQSWATCHDSSNAEGYSCTSTTETIMRLSEYTGPLYRMWRGFFAYNLAAEAMGVVDWAAITFVAASTPTATIDAGWDACLEEWSAPDLVTLAVSDYGLAGDPPTLFSSRVDNGEWTGDLDWATFTLNADGRDYISGLLGVGPVGFILRTDRDVDDNPSSAGNNTHNMLEAYMSESTGHDPKLEWTAESGDACWGHDSGVTETPKDLSDWTGTATVSGSGDSEIITFTSGQEKISPLWYLGAGAAEIELNFYGFYGSGDTFVIQYKTGTTRDNCLADSWHDFSTSFTCTGWAQIRLAPA